MSLLRRFDDEVLRLDNLVAAEAWDELYYRLNGGEGIHYLCEAMVAQGVVQEGFEDVCFDILNQIESYVDDIRDADEDERSNVVAVKGSEISGLLSQLQGLAYDYQVYSSRRNKSVNSSEGVSMSQYRSRVGRPAHRIQSAMVQDHLDELGHEFVVAVEVLRDHVAAGRWSSVWNDCDALYSIAKEVEGTLAGANQQAMDTVFAHLVKVNEVVYECSTMDSHIYRSERMDLLDDALYRALGALEWVIRHS